MISILLQAINEGVLFRSEKIFTVMIVLLIIWAGIILYLTLTNRKISKLEKQLREKQ